MSYCKGLEQALKNIIIREKVGKRPTGKTSLANTSDSLAVQTGCSVVRKGTLV